MTTSAPLSPVSPPAAAPDASVLSASAMSPTGERDKKKEKKAGMTAGFSRAMAVAAARAFANPVKVFKPYKSNWKGIMESRLQHQGVQIDSTGGMKGSWKLLKYTYQTEGMKGVARTGLGPIFADSVIGAIMFTTYLKTLENQGIGDKKGVKTASIKHVAIAGMAAGACQGILTTPLETVLHRIQKHSPHPFKFDGLFRGGSAIFVRDVIGVSFFFSTYELIKNVLIGKKNKDGSLLPGDGDLVLSIEKGPSFFEDDEEEEQKPDDCVKCEQVKLSLSEGDLLLNAEARRTLGEKARYLTAVVVAGAVAGFGYRIIHLPFAKVHREMRSSSVVSFPSVTRHQASQKRKTFWECAGILIRREGFLSLFSGVRLALMRSLPPSVIGIFAFEWAKGDVHWH